MVSRIGRWVDPKVGTRMMMVIDDGRAWGFIWLIVWLTDLLGERDAVEDGPVVGRQGQEQPPGYMRACVRIWYVSLQARSTG